MKKVYSLFTFAVLIIFSSCGFDVKNDTNAESAKFERSELYGQWNNTSEKAGSKNGVINKINLKDDLTAEIQLIDADSVRNVSGSWEINNGKKLGSKFFNVSSDSGITLVFDRDDSHREMLVIGVEEGNKNNNKILVSDGDVFEKE